MHKMNPGRPPSPELHACLCSLLTWHWITPLLKLGNTKILQKEDLYELIPADKASNCEELWKQAVAHDEHKISVWAVLFRSLGRAYFMAALWKPVWLAAVLLQVYVLKELVQVAESRSRNLHWWRGMLLVLTMFMAVVAQSVAQNNLFSQCQRLSMRARSMITMAIHDKLLSLKLAVSGAFINEGTLLNLLTNDTQKLIEAGGNFHFAWFSIVEVLVVSGLIVAEAGISAAPGVIFVLMTQPLPVWMSWTVGRFRMLAIRYTDDRVRLVGELLAGIKTVKFNGWTAPFLVLISQIRHNELQWIRKACFLKLLILTLKDAVVPIASMLIFWTHAKLYGQLTASMSFSVLALLGVLVRVFNFAPTGIQYAGEAMAAVQRLQTFFNISKLDEVINTNKGSSGHCEASVYVRDGWFQWDTPSQDFGCTIKEPSKSEVIVNTDKHSGKPLNKEVPLGSVHSHGFFLQAIDLRVEKGQLIGITGAISSGKSSLLLALLGETECIKGTCIVEKPVAYVPQKPWIFNGSIRDNVLFGCKYSAPHYEKTMMACALDYDLRHLPAADHTEIGERGLNLSGGQKARISLARACYSSAPVVFLDDPFASIDGATSSHLVQHVLHGVLKGRTTILTVHNRNMLEYCDQIFVMDGGNLLAIEFGASDLKTRVPKESLPTTDDDLEEHPCNLGKTGQLDEQDDAEKSSSFSLHDHPFQTASPDLPLVAESSTCAETGPATRPENMQSSLKNGTVKGLTSKEDRVEGIVTWKTINTYLRSGRYYNFLLVWGAFLGTQAGRALLTYWLAIWADRVYNLKLEAYGGVYACLATGATLLSIVRAVLFSTVTNMAAKNMHQKMIDGIFYSPLTFFEENLCGRVLNRLTKDQACIDEMLPNTAQSMLENLVGCVGSIVMIAIVVPWFLLALPPFVGVLLYYQRRYTAVSRELKRLDGISRSPIIVHFTEVFQGITSIRAYNMQEKMHEQLAHLVDGNHAANILFQHVSRWLSFRLDLAAATCVAITALLVVLLHSYIAPGIAGLVLVQSLQLTGLFQLGIRMAADTENHFTSVERVRHYADLEQEAPLVTPPGLIPNIWPSEGEIIFSNYTMSYRKDLAPVLSNMTLKVKSREKVGLLGRTGAGKSSLAMALFHMVDNVACSGSIHIDGVDIKSVGVDDLRQRLSIVPQDPVLFKETIRMNLDPFQQFTDVEIHEVLGAVQLLSKIQSLDLGIYAVVGDNGNNFSVGECQLLCLARALLRRSRVLVMDEATSAVDVDIDALIQRVLLKAFEACTVLTIAHRLSTLRYCNRVLLLSHGGNISELDRSQISIQNMEASTEFPVHGVST